MAQQQTYERNNIFKDFDISFSYNPITGDVGSKTDENAINQSVKNLINTNFYERPFQPELGCNVRGMLFEIADPITMDNMRTVIAETLFNNEPRISVKNIYIEDLTDKNSYHINIEYVIRGVNKIGSYETVLKRLR